jgi:iron complex outermembrane receptor protein
MTTVLILGIFLFKPVIYGETGKTGDEDSLKKLLEIKISTAAKYDQTVSEAPASVTIITAEEIEQFGYRTLDEILMRVKGFYITNDLIYNYLGVRGFSRPTDYNNRILLLINGKSINDNAWGASYIGTESGINLDIIERIEVVRGPGSAIYGNNAMLAVINIITKRGKTVDGLKLTLQPGSYGKIQGGIRFGKEFKNGLDLLVSGHVGHIKGKDFYFQEYDDPATNNGIAEGIDGDQYWGIFTSLTYKNFSWKGFTSYRDKAIPTAPYGTIFNDERPKTIIGFKFMELKYKGNLSYNKKIVLSGFYDYYLWRGEYPYGGMFYQTLINNRSIGELFGMEIQFNWEIEADNRLLTGVAYRNHFHVTHDIRDDDGVIYNQSYPFHELSFYIQDEYQFLRNLSFTLGVRYDYFSNRKESISPRAAVIYNVFSSTTLKLLFGNAYRAPDLFSLYYEFENQAKANPFIKPEKINTFELVAEQQFNSKIYGTLSLYTFEMRGLIEQAIDPLDGLLQFQNLEKVRGKGVEVGLNIRLQNGLKGYINYSFQNNKNVLDNEKISNSPSHVFKFGLSAPIGKYFFASLETFYESNRITVYRTGTDPYLLTNLHISSRKLLNHLKFSFQARNLFGVEYRLPGGYEHIQHTLPQNGRNFTFKIELSL